MRVNHRGRRELCHAGIWLHGCAFTAGSVRRSLNDSLLCPYFQDTAKSRRLVRHDRKRKESNKLSTWKWTRNVQDPKEGTETTNGRETQHQVLGSKSIQALATRCVKKSCRSLCLPQVSTIPRCSERNGSSFQEIGAPGRGAEGRGHPRLGCRVHRLPPAVCCQ